MSGDEKAWAVALVHGIGTTDRMQMIHEVSGALRTVRPDLRLDTAAEVHEVHERNGKVVGSRISSRSAKDATTTENSPPGTTEDTDGGTTQIRFNVVRHGHFPGGRVRIGTAHWADITYYRQGLVSLIGALMMTAFGVRFFAEVSATTGRSSNIAVRVLSWLQRHILKKMVQVIALVVFPVTFVALIFSCMGLFGIYIFKQPDFTTETQKRAIIIIGTLLCLVAAWVGVTRSWEFRRERPLAVGIFATIGVVAVVLGLAMLAGNRIWLAIGQGTPLQIIWWPGGANPPVLPFKPLWLVIRDFLVWVCEIFNNGPLGDRIKLVDRTGAYFALMHCLQLAAGILLLLMTLAATINLAVLSAVAWISGDRVRTFTFATVSVITIWIINLILLWPENLATFAAMTQFLDDDRLKDTITVNAFNWQTWSFEHLTFSLGDAVKDRPGFMKNRLYADTYPVMWFEAVFLLFLAATVVLVLATFVARAVWCRRHAKTDLALFEARPGETSPRYANWPRLIISFGYLTLVLMLIVVVPGILLAIIVRNSSFAQMIPFVGAIGDTFSKVQDISVSAEWARVGVIAFLASFLLFSHLIRDGAKLVLDVVNHFTPRAAKNAPWLPWKRGADHVRYPVRQRIEKRFEEMIDALLGQNDKPHLVIIAHSQGTIITLDALMRRDWIDQLLTKVESLTVITFGSPVSHVYQTYFPRLYQPFSKTSLVDLSAHPRVQWLNVYRIDDYVGNFVDNSIKDFPVNVPVPRGGHTHYWSKDVFVELFKRPQMERVLR